MLADGRAFLLGSEPCLADFSGYHPLYGLAREPAHRGVAGAAAARAGLARARACDRAREASEFTAAQAIEVARAAEPARFDGESVLPDGMSLGARVVVMSDEFGSGSVVGELAASGLHEIAIRRRGRARRRAGGALPARGLRRDRDLTRRLVAWDAARGAFTPMRDGAKETRAASWFRPADLADPIDAHIAATVQILSLSFIVAIAGFAVAAGFLPLPRSAFWIPLSAMGVFLAAHVLARVGRAHVAAQVLVAGIWLSTTWAVAITGSANSPALGAYLIVIMAAGFLIGKRAAVWAAAVSAISILLLAHLEVRGLLPDAIRQTPWITAATMLTLMAATAALLWDALARLGSAVSRAERSEARMRELIDQASDAIIVLDSEGNVREASARAAEMSGYAREEITRMRVSEFLAGEELDEAQGLLRELEPGFVVMRERRLRRKDGSWLPVENSVARLTDGRVQ